MMKQLCTFTLVLFALVAQAQSGYLGRLNFVEARIGLVPSYRHTNVIKDGQAIERLKCTNPTYRLSYSRIFARNFEMSLGYEYARINGISDRASFEQTDTLLDEDGDFNTIQYDQNILDDPSFVYHGAQLSFNFYRLGSLAPVGKYIGFTICVGNTKIPEGQMVLVGKAGLPEKENFFRSVSPIVDMDTTYISEARSIRVTQFKARIGRNYPLTDNIMLNLGMTFPILSKYSVNGSPFYSFQVNDSFHEDEDSSWAHYTMNAIRMYNRVTLEAGIRFLF